MPTSVNRIKLWSVGGGKGGIGKSLVTLGLGVALARLGKKVILIDGDLGGANLHTLMGVRYPHVTLEHFLTKKVTRLEDTVIETAVEGINLICGADDLMGSANPTFAQKFRLLQQIDGLAIDGDLERLGNGGGADAVQRGLFLVDDEGHALEELPAGRERPQVGRRPLSVGRRRDSNVRVRHRQYRPELVA